MKIEERESRNHQNPLEDVPFYLKSMFRDQVIKAFRLRAAGGLRSSGRNTYAACGSRLRKFGSIPGEERKDLPETMSGILCRNPGVISKSNLVYSKSIPIPLLKSTSEILIKVHAASISSLDYATLLGYSKAAADSMSTFQNLQNFVPGSCFSGEIVDISPYAQSEQYSLGKAVFGCLGFPPAGAFSEYIKVPLSSCILKPENLSHEVASCIGYDALLGVQSLHRNIAEIQKENHSPISIAIVDEKPMALECGPSFFALQWCRSRNIHHKFFAGVSELIRYDAKNEFDILLDFEGGHKIWEESTRVLKRKGARFITTQGDYKSQDREQDISIHTLFQEGITSAIRALGSGILGRPSFELIEVDYSNILLLRTIASDLSTNKMRCPKISKTFSLREFHSALEHFLRKSTIGKVVITLTG